MRYITQQNYKHSEGRKFSGRTRVQLADYEPLPKMLANLTIAGLNSSAKVAAEYYDSFDEKEIDIPLLPRHITPDITKVYEIAKEFGRRRQLIEEKAKELRQKAIDKKKADYQALLAKQAEQVNGASPLAGAGGSAPPPDGRNNRP